MAHFVSPQAVVNPHGMANLAASVRDHAQQELLFLQQGVLGLSVFPLDVANPRTMENLVRNAADLAEQAPFPVCMDTCAPHPGVANPPGMERQARSAPGLAHQLLLLCQLLLRQLALPAGVASRRSMASLVGSAQGLAGHAHACN